MATGDYYYSSGTNTTTADLVWHGWNYATAATNDCTWPAWNTSTATSCATTNTATTWVYWNDQYYVLAEPVTNPMTADQLAEAAQRHRERQAELQAQAAKQARLAAEADSRAAELLKANLTEAQRLELAREQSFTVVSRDGQRNYRVKKGWSHNVERIDEAGKRLHTLCAHPSVNVPLYDNMLAQKLMLEHSEDDFLRIANRGAA